MYEEKKEPTSEEEVTGVTLEFLKNIGCKRIMYDVRRKSLNLKLDEEKGPKQDP